MSTTALHGEVPGFDSLARHGNGTQTSADKQRGKAMKCTDCERVSASLTPCEGRRLCPSCTSAYLTDASQSFNANYYGEQYRYARGNALPVTPRRAS